MLPASSNRCMRTSRPPTTPRAECANPGSTGASIASATTPNANSCGGGCWRPWRTCAAPAATGCACAIPVLKLCADISRHPPPLAADVIAESRALLQYMEAHHFTFLGFRESRLRRGRGPALVPVPGSALGLLRRRLSGTQDGIATANIRRALRSPGMLIITKANHRSTVHRPGYLDYIGVKRYDAARPGDRRGPHPRALDLPRLRRRSAPGAVAAPQAQARAGALSIRGQQP